MSTIKREDAMTALKEVMKTLKLDLSVSDAEYMVPRIAKVVAAVAFEFAPCVHHVLIPLEFCMF